MNSVLRPAIGLMNRLRLPQRFAVLGLIALSALGIIGASYYAQLNRVIEASQVELTGVELIRLLIHAQESLQYHRGLTGAVLSGDASMKDALGRANVEVISSLEDLGRKLSLDPSRKEEWQQIDVHWKRIQSDGLSFSAEMNFEAHVRLISDLQVLRRHVADAYRLSSDPDIDSHYLLDTSSKTLPEALEKLAQLRGLATSALAKKELTENQRRQILALIAELNSEVRSLRFNLLETARYNPSIQSRLVAAESKIDRGVETVIADLESNILSGTLIEAPSGFFELVTSVLHEEYSELYNTMLPTVSALLQERIRGARRQLVIDAVSGAVLLLVGAYLSLGIYFSTLTSVRSIARSAHKYASGDLKERLTLTTRDEFAQIGDSFNLMADGMAKLLSARIEDEQRLRSIVDAALDGVIQMDADGKVSGWTRQATTIFGWKSEESIGQPMHELIIPKHYREAHVRGLKHFLATGQGPALGKRLELEGLHKDGHTFPIELAIASLQRDGAVEFSAFVRDISDRREAEADLRVAAIAFESGEGIAITDAKGRAIRVNQAFSNITGYSREDMLGQSPLLLKSDRQDEKQIHEMRRSLSKDGVWQGELLGKRKDGNDFPEWIRVSSVCNAAGTITNYVVSFSDISERKRAEETIHKLAFYDPLTGLPNRTLLQDRLKQIIVGCNRNNASGAVLFIDLDNFKMLNDSHGHDKGDQLLQRVARRLTDAVREDDTVARLSGDEFVVVLTGLNPDLTEAATQAEMVAKKLLETLCKRYVLDDVSHTTSASIGVTLFSSSEKSVEDLLKQADMAMYKSKQAGRNAMHFFDPAMQTAANERSRLENYLYDAVIQQQFVLHYQAQVDQSGRVVGAEALIRWQHPEHGLISPAKFIPLAEESGMILPIGHWVMETVCAAIASWQEREGLSQVKIAVNVSARQFSLPNFVEQVLMLVKHYGISPEKLKLELTESLLLDNTEEIISKMVLLKERGIQFSLDDFGTGYSSLSYLKRLPLSQLKIDQSFVRDVLTDPNDAAIARTVVSLAQSLGLEVIAEGVETDDQRHFLELEGCSLYQGYLFSKPLPIEAFEQYCVVRSSAAA